MPGSEQYRPPKWADRLLEWYCAPEHLEDVQGALYEYFYERAEAGQLKKARNYFVRDVLAHFRPHLIKKTRAQKLISTIMLKNNIKISVRSLWRHKLTTILNTLGLTIGIGCFLMIVLWVNHERSFDAFHMKADRIYRIANTFTSESEQFSQAISGPALGAQLDDLYPQVENAMRFGLNSVQVRVDKQSFFEERVAMADLSIFDIFDFEVVSGNLATMLEGPNSLAITESMALKYFGDVNPIGKMVTLDEQVVMEVTGVLADLPSNSQLRFDMLFSIDFLKRATGNTTMDDNWGGGQFHTYLLLRPEVDAEALQAEITDFIATKLTWFTERNMAYEYFLQPLMSIHLESDLRYDFANNGSATNVKVFSIVAIVVLLLACVNYINLTTANAVKRAREMGMKKVMGALRSQLVSQYLVESVIVVLASTILAVAIVYLAMPSLELFIGYPVVFELTVNTAIVLLAGALLLGLVAGMIPALVISSFKSLDVIKGRLNTGIKGALVRKGLVVFQFTVTIALIVAIITVNRQMQFIQNQDLGMETDEVLYINFRGIQEVRNNKQVLTDRLLQHPAVKVVSFQRNGYPVDGLSNGTVMVEKGDGSRASSSLYHMWVDEHFEDAFGIQLLAGRFLDRSFPTDSTQSVVVNEAALAAFGWGSPDEALGKEMGNAPNVRKVIGVVRDFNFEGLHKKVQPVRILPVGRGSYGTLAIRANLSQPVDLLRFLESTWAEVNPSVPLDYRFMNEDINRQYEAELSFRAIFMFFSTLSVIIACLGLFGLATASANQRIREIGIRKALGASTPTLVKLISQEFLILVCVALILAAPIAWYSMELWLDSFAYRISFSWTFVLLSGLLAIVVSFLTVSYEALRAALRNPTQSLRHE